MSSTILIADDDELLRISTRMLLEKQGYSVLEAFSGANALEISSKSDHAIDLLLTDIVMPDMDGGELAEKIATTRPGIRILFISGSPHAEIFERMRIQKDLVLIPKPFESADLLLAIRSALEG